MSDKRGLSKLGNYLPNYITFSSLGFGLISILLAARGNVMQAGLFILVAVVLDSLDGFFARRLSLESNFGLQLDSLADMVCFGVAPVVLLSQHLFIQNGSNAGLLPFFLLQVWAGAFRLARFNLQPPKGSSNGESVGLTISQAGAILTLMILSDISQTGLTSHIPVVMILVLVLSFLMVSRVKFPSFSWFVPHPAMYGLHLLAVVLLTLLFSFFTALWILWLVVLAASILRHLFQAFGRAKVTL